MRRRRLAIILVVALAIGLVIAFPLRVAIDMTTDETSPLTARQVGGSIWDGRIGDLGLRGQPLGTFDIATRPLPLLIGRFEMEASRIDTEDGPLSLKLVTGGGREGIIDANGRIEVQRLVAPVPIDSILLEDVTILFEDGACATAEGQFSALPHPALPLAVDSFEGGVSCSADGRARAEMTSNRGGHAVALLFDNRGSIVAEARTTGAPPALAAALQLAGFVVEGDSLVLRTDVK